MLARRWAMAEAERAALLQLARRSGLGAEDAEDCVQEAILHVVPRSDLDEARLGALLATVVKRRAIDLHRRSQRASAARWRAGALRAIDLAVDPPDVAVCDRAEAVWLASLAERLPRTQREVLLARADGRSWSEIASELSMSLKGVDSALLRGRAALRAALTSTLGFAFAVVRRLREPASVAASAGAALVMIVVTTLPVLRPLDRDGDGARDGARPPSSSSSSSNEASMQPVSAVHDGSGGGRPDAPRDGSSGNDRPALEAAPSEPYRRVLVPGTENSTRVGNETAGADLNPGVYSESETNEEEVAAMAEYGENCALGHRRVSPGYLKEGPEGGYVLGLPMVYCTDDGPLPT